MERTRSKQQKPISRKRKQEQKMQGTDDGKVGTMKKHSNDDGGIDKLPDDVLINILSRLSLKEAGRASVLARGWRYLWRFGYGTLRFDNRDAVTVMDREKFELWVNTVVEHHQTRYIEGMAICFDAGGWEFEPSVVDSWVNFAMRKEAQRFELKLPFNDRYEFPSVLISVSNPLCHLRTLRLDHVDIMDHVVHYFLANCPNLEELCIHFSQVTMNLRVVDPPRLRLLEIHMYRCLKIQSLEVSAVNLVSLSYGGKEKSLKLMNIPNLRELTISDDFCLSFVMKPKDHTSYSVQLEKLVLDFQLMNSNGIRAPYEWPQLCSLKRLEVQVYTAAYRYNVFYVAAILEACRKLCEFRVELFHTPYPTRAEPLPFPIVQPSDAEKKIRRKIKVVDIAGYIGCSNDDDFIWGVIETGRSSILKVTTKKSIICNDFFRYEKLNFHQ